MIVFRKRKKLIHPSPAEIAKSAKGPAAKALTWEGWRAHDLHVGPMSEQLSRQWFDRWWNDR